MFAAWLLMLLIFSGVFTDITHCSDNFMSTSVMVQCVPGVNARVRSVKVADTRCHEEYEDQDNQYYHLM